MDVFGFKFISTFSVDSEFVIFEGVEPFSLKKNRRLKSTIDPVVPKKIAIMMIGDLGKRCVQCAIDTKFLVHEP